MSILVDNVEEFLPGVVTDIEAEYGKEYDTSLFGTTDSVVIIGTAFNGPVNIPTPIYSPEHAGYIFGKSYDAKTRKEMDLVAGVQDLWDNGCRTIYAMRINGKDLYKDFNFCVDNGMKLRIASTYPSNISKQVYLKFDNTAGNESIKLYKPASRATIKEKMNGMVESDGSVMVTEIKLGQDYSITKDTKLIDVIEIINSHAYNNNLTLSIVDEDGNDVTTSADAYSVTLGHVYPGIYFIGRNESLCEKRTEVAIKLIVGDNDIEKPFTDFDGKYYRNIDINTDVSLPYPIYSKDIKTMREILLGVGISMVKDGDYLEYAEISNSAFKEDGVDYEESDLTSFELYKKLGNGYAISAVAEQRKSADGKDLAPKVKEAKLTDQNRIVPITDGAYSILQNVNIKHHVLGSKICIDQKIKGKIPKYTEFKTTVAQDISIFNELITATAKVKEDNEEKAKEYSFKIKDTSQEERPVISQNNLNTENIITGVAYAENEEDFKALQNIPVGEFVLVLGENPELYVSKSASVIEKVTDENYADRYFRAGTELYHSMMDSDVFKVERAKVVADTCFNDKEYAIVENSHQAFVCKIVSDGLVEPVGELNLLMSESDDLIVYMESNSAGNNVVEISYRNFDSLTMEDFISMLNENSVLGKAFEFSLTTDGSLYKDEYVKDADAAMIANKGKNTAFDIVIKMDADRVHGYDYSKHIPYTTSDNFGRQLAQHCTYTHLKTAPAEGYIGFSRVTDISINNIAKKISEIEASNWDLYAKNNIGKNMLDRTNNPYSIAKNVIAVFEQNKVTTPSSYVQICNGATAVAGLTSSLKLEQAPTNQPINIVPMFELTSSQLEKLTKLGIITVRKSFTKGYVVTDGITLASNDDPMKRIFAIRIVGYVEDLLRAACEPFIGTPNSIANRNSLNTAINSALTPLKDILLQKFSFRLIDDGNALNLNYIDIDYDLVLINEIRNIKNSLRVSK